MLGVVPGTMGILQATEALKLLLGIGDPLVGRLLIYDALDSTFQELKLRRDPACPACGDHRGSRRRRGGPPPRPKSHAAAGQGASVTAVRSLPAARRRECKQVDVPGGTVGEVLNGLVTQFPALRDQLMTADGDLNRFVNVYVNGRDVRYEQELATPVAESDTLILLPAMAGG